MALVSIIAAVSENGVIGDKGKIPWHIKKDLLHFRDKTAGRVVIMGRKSFDWMMDYYRKSKNPLPKRIHIIVTRNKDYVITEVNSFMVHSVKEALDLAKTLEKKEIFVGGGEQLYGQTIDRADKLYLTIVKGNFKGDAYFPDYKKFMKVIFDSGWQKENNYIFKFIELLKS